MDGILSVIAGNQSIVTVLMYAAFDTVIVAGGLALISAFGFALEWIFKKVLALFIGKEKVEVLEGYITYPGTVIHECSHALFALLTGAKIVKFSLRRRPLEDGSGYVLGELAIAHRGGSVAYAFQKTLTGIAPAIVGTLIMGLMIFLLFPALDQWWQWIIAGYLFVCVLLHTGLSKQDLASAQGGIAICVATLFVVFLFFPFDPLAVLVNH